MSLLLPFVGDFVFNILAYERPWQALLQESRSSMQNITLFRNEILMSEVNVCLTCLVIESLKSLCFQEEENSNMHHNM